MDFIVGVSELNEYNTILVVVDRLTTIVHYIPTRENANDEKAACLCFYKYSVFTVSQIQSFPTLILSLYQCFPALYVSL